jgi:peroxiredoxin family protein
MSESKVFHTFCGFNKFNHDRRSQNDTEIVFVSDMRY